MNNCIIVKNNNILIIENNRKKSIKASLKIEIEVNNKKISNIIIKNEIIKKIVK